MVLVVWWYGGQVMSCGRAVVWCEVQSAACRLEMPSIKFSIMNSLSVSVRLIPVFSAEVPITRSGTALWLIRLRELESSKNTHARGGTDKNG